MYYLMCAYYTSLQYTGYSNNNKKSPNELKQIYIHWDNMN